MGMRNSQRYMAAAFSILALIGAASAEAQMTFISGPATSWRVEVDVPDQVQLWYTGSLCNSGNVVLPSSSVKADRDRLVAVVATSKATGSTMFINYHIDPVSTMCVIDNFGLDAN